MCAEEIMSSKKSFNTFINKLRKENFFTTEGDAVWKRFVDDVIPLALFGDGSTVGYNKGILEQIALDSSYALEFRARALFVSCTPDHSSSPIYWPHKKPPFITSDAIDRQGVLNYFAAQMLAHCIAYVAENGSNDPCDRQSRIHAYMNAYFGFNGFEQSLIHVDRDVARRAIDILATIPIIASFDGFSLHPLTKLYEGSLDTELLGYLDERIRRVVLTCVQRCASKNAQCETLSDYVFLIRHFIGSARLRSDGQQLISTQISFILRMRREYGVTSEHPVRSLGSSCVPALFSILADESFAPLRREIALYIIETSPELLWVGKNIINCPASVQGVRLMLESLSDEDRENAERIRALLNTYERHERSRMQRRRLEDREQKKRNEIYATTAESALVAMRQTV